MARLVPSFMDDRTPPGERDVFNLLAPGPDDWVALHSLDLAPWNRGLRTEIDFVIIVPDTGILCVEVKSHQDILFDGCRWHPDAITRSPFKQASDGRHTFYRRLAEIAPQFSFVPVVHCCIFPRSSFDLQPNLSVQPWEVMDLRAFRKFESGTEFCMDLKKRMTQAIPADARIKKLSNPLSRSQIDTLVRFCVPVQKVNPTARDEINRREEEIEKLLREQQKPVLQLAALNDRVIVSGGAGTGKTLIAMEVARRAAEKGRRVALLCYNQLIGNWMQQKMEKASPALPNLVVGRAIRVMAEMAGLAIAGNAAQDYWEVILPRELEERLTDPDFKCAAAFEYLVLDEAQDMLAKPRLWQCLTQFLDGGDGQGAFALFGDFAHQVLVEREPMQRSLVGIDRTNRPVHWDLTENCRNYRIVGDTAVQLAGFTDPVYSAYLRSGGGLHNYDIFFYDNDTTQINRLGQWIKEFKAQGYRSSEITVLSFRADHLSAASRLDSAFKVHPAWQANAGTRHASIHAFKGLENKVIILTDVSLIDRDFQRDLFYTGLTRATESVRVLCDKRSQDILFRWFSGKAD
jgi:hypothetical protein